jgi:beta-phosphoglucomutase-like phosphatase (HAD superfamily)
VFEDSQAGLEAAKAAEMVAVAVPNRFAARQDFHRADFVITALTADAELRSRGCDHTSTCPCGVTA